MSTTTQDDDVLRSFTGLLESSTPLTIPDETLYGAITHFLSTLQSSHLKSFVELLITSHSLWLQKERSLQISEATKLAVFAKIEALNKQFERAYFPAYRREKHAKKWASDIKDCVIASESSVSRRALLVGLAEGMKGFNINWGKIQEEVEEELVLEAASLGASDEGIETLCPILNHVSEERLWALDLADILPKLHERIQGEQDPDLAKAFGRLLKVMDNGQEDHRRQAWAEMKSFCSDPLIEHSSFLVVAEGIIDILVQSEPPSIASSSRDTTHLSADIASDIIYQLFAHPQEDSTERAYQYALCGSLDIIEARGGPDAVARLIGRLVPGSPDSLRPEQAAFVFSVAEQTVNLLDASTVRDVLLPLCQDHLRMTDKSNSFEAAHEFLIALVKSFVDAPGDQRVQIPFMSELLSWYARVLLRQFIDEDVTADQLKAAYPTVADASAHCGDTVIHNCINLVLDRLSSVKEPGKAQALRALRIELASYVPFPDLAQYLDDLAWCILDSESGTRYRSSLAEAAYHMVIQGLPDESRRMGMEWWLKWKDAFEDKDKERAKL